MKITAFSIPIFKYKVDNWNIKKKELLNLFNSLEHKIVDNVITSSFNIKTNIFSNEIKLFQKDIGINFYTVEVWFQKYENNMDHSAHNHGSTGFSSVCFIEYDKKFHKPTTFICPFQDFITGQFNFYEPDVNEGDIIFFPSNILHYAPINMSNKTRIVMSFNLKIKTINQINYNYE